MLILLIAAALAGEPTSDRADGITIETFNTGLAHGYVDLASARAPLIIDAIQRSDADVLCLQEVWTKRDRATLLNAVNAQFPYQVAPNIVVQRSDTAPSCKRSDLFGEGKFLHCMSKKCGDTSGDERTDCIIEKCNTVLNDLKNDKPGCAQALFAQVGRSTLGALMALISPFRGAKTFAYDGSSGLILLSKRPLQNLSTLDFTDISTLNRRQALVAELHGADGEPMRVYCMHLTANLDNQAPYPGPFDSWSAENMQQVSRLLDHAKQGPTQVVLTGDFNCSEPDSTNGIDAESPQSCAAIRNASFVDIQPSDGAARCTWCADNLINASENDSTNSTLDHIFVRGLAASDARRVYDTPVSVNTSKSPQTSTSLSDHFGFRATLVAPPPPAPEEVEPEAGSEAAPPAPAGEPE